MQKCVKILISGIQDIDLFYKDCKKSLNTDTIEGVAQPTEDHDIAFVVHGSKESVDAFVLATDEVTSKYAQKYDQEVNFFVEPFFKEENYRGLFRFIKADAVSDA